MRVEMLISISGTVDGKSWPVKGGVIELPDAIAADLITARHARAVESAPVLEAAARKAPEKRA